MADNSNGFKMVSLNITCPECKAFGYMYYLYGDNVRNYNMKCLNCNTYFISELKVGKNQMSAKLEEELNDR